MDQERAGRTGDNRGAAARPHRLWTGACLAVALAVGLGGCGGDIRTRGHLVEDRNLAELTVGQSTAEDVLQTLGTPSTVAPFDDHTWYYIGQREEQTAFFRPEVLERRVVMVRFDEAGVLSEMGERTLDDAEDVALVNRETPSLGREMGFLEQMLGNIGRFNPSGETSDSPF
ncbi:MAG: outer membrane protein assembly factor BamE [Rhodospirillaceae bacterium]|nr:outer membrane protein assembly factor BamE [Rhodospirillaceae bacterium]